MFFCSEKVPKELMKKEGSCLMITVWDYDVILEDDFAGELFYPLTYVDSMEKFSTIDMMPVVINELEQPNSFEKNRFGVN